METSEQALLILGTRTFAVEVADLVSEVPGFRVAGFVENMEPERCRDTLEGLPVLWVDEVTQLAHTHRAICGLSTTFRSRFTEQVAAYGMPFATLAHPSARISSKSSLGEGTVVSAGVIVAARTHLGRHVLVNRGVLVGHHTVVGDYVTLSPGANVAGACHVGTATYVGMGAIVLDHIRVGSHSIVAAGAVVTKDVPDHVMVAGVPARVVKEDIAGL